MEKSKSPLNVAIVGAGIGGLALAIGLLRQNVPYTLYEAAPEYSVVGAGVGLGPNSLRAMNMIDSRFKALYDGIATGNKKPEKSNVIFDVHLVEDGFGIKQGWSGAPVGAPYYTRTSAHRKDLLDIMTSLIPAHTVKFNKKVTSITQDSVSEKVTITFADGEVVRADTVIGCDGVKGASRAAVLGPEHPNEVAPTYSGKYVYRSIVPMADAVALLGEYAGDGRMFMGPGCNILAYPISKGTQLNVVAFRYREWDHPLMTREVTREEMVGDFEGCDERLVRLLDWAKPLQWSLWHHLTTPTYYHGRICLLGDSAHASTPHQAAGAGQCLEDALVLSRLLGLVNSSLSLSQTQTQSQSQSPPKKPSSHKTTASPEWKNPTASNSPSRTLLQTAFRIYDAHRRPRAQAVVRTSAECGEVYCLVHPECGNDMQKVVRNLNQRFEWIWRFDLEGLMERVVGEWVDGERDVVSGKINGEEEMDGEMNGERRVNGFLVQ